MKLSRLVCATLFVSTSVMAHSLWVLAEGERIEVVFEHAMKPGEGAYNRDILAKGETWVRTPNSGKHMVELSEVGPKGSRYLVGTTDRKAPRSVEHFCLFGIYQGRLDYFYGKHLDVSSPAELSSLASAEGHPIDIVLEALRDSLEVRVLWDGEPLESHRIAVIDPTGKETRLRTGEDSILRFTPEEPGRYGFWSVVVNDENEGVHDGARYTGTMHSATASVEWPLSE